MTNAGTSRPVQIALGSNVGDRVGNLLAALSRLAESGKVSAVSGLYITEPVGGVVQPAFYNAACTVQTALPLIDLLDELKRIEWDQGRRPGIRWGPRLLDLDILLAGAEVVDDERLTVPHPRLHERAFVLVPLADIAPDAVHPLLGLTVLQLRDALSDEDRNAVEQVAERTWAEAGIADTDLHSSA